MRENFNIALGFVLRHEGGYINDPADPGGETNYGISKRYHPNEDIKNMTPKRAGEIYLEEYWMPACDLLHFPFDIIYFDTAVNMGRDDANEYLADAPSWEIMLARRVKGYYDKTVNRPKSIKYLFGWLQRCLDLYKFIKEESKGRV
jgi:hypothetical protein